MKRISLIVATGAFCVFAAMGVVAVLAAGGSYDIYVNDFYNQQSAHWLNLDNEFVPAILPWDWEMISEDYEVRVKEDFTAGQILEFAVNGSTVQFQPMALQWSNDLDQIQPIATPHEVTPVVTNPEVVTMNSTKHEGTIVWGNAYGATIDFEWHTTPTTLKKTLTVSAVADLPEPEAYIIDGGNPVLKLNLIFDPSAELDIYVNGVLWDRKTKVQTFDAVEFFSNGVMVWTFNPLLYWDSSGNEGQSVATLEKSGNSLYISIRVPYDWLQAALFPVYIDADVAIETGADTATHSISNRGGPYWRSTTTGYIVFVDGGGNLSYRKTTDGGGSWGSAVEMHSGTVHSIDCWADWATPGDTGTKIHIAYICSSDEDVLYAYIDTNGDSYGTDIIDSTTISASDLRTLNNVGITKSRGGKIAVLAHSYTGAAHEYGFYTSTDGDTWEEETHCIEDNLDAFVLYPGYETDEDDLWCMYLDASAQALSLKTYDDSLDTWGEYVVAAGMSPGLAYWMMDGAIRHSDGHLMFTAWTTYDVATADIRCWDISSGSAVSKGEVVENTDDCFCVATMIDQTNDDIYVAYLGNEDGSETAGTAVTAFYKVSDDGGSSWSSQSAMQANVADDERWISGGFAAESLGGNWMPVWFNDDLNDLFCNTDNAVTISAPAEEGYPHSWGTIIG